VLLILCRNETFANIFANVEELFQPNILFLAKPRICKEYSCLRRISKYSYFSGHFHFFTKKKGGELMHPIILIMDSVNLGDN
jgi:hypothetical protein